jgi:hypothetical protein
MRTKKKKTERKEKGEEKGKKEERGKKGERKEKGKRKGKKEEKGKKKRILQEGGDCKSFLGGSPTKNLVPFSGRSPTKTNCCFFWVRIPIKTMDFLARSPTTKTAAFFL